MSAWQQASWTAALLAALLVAWPQQVTAQNFCWECEDIGMGCCLACVAPVDLGFDRCEPTCSCFCYVNSAEPECFYEQNLNDLLSLAAGTFSSPAADRLAGSPTSATDVNGAGAWSETEIALGQVRRNCKGYITARVYPAPERERLREASRRIVI